MCITTVCNILWLTNKVVCVWKKQNYIHVSFKVIPMQVKSTITSIKPLCFDIINELVDCKLDKTEICFHSYANDPILWQS